MAEESSRTPGSLTLRTKNLGPQQGDHVVGEVRPGLNALIGPNEAGKTRLLAALRLLPLPRLRLEGMAITDGQDQAAVGLGPAELVVTRRGERRAARRTGERDLPPMVDLPDPIETLVTGDDIQDPEARWRRRVKALLQIRPLALDHDLAERLAPGGIDWISGSASITGEYGDLLELVQVLRRDLQAQARVSEEEAERHIAEARVRAVEADDAGRAVSARLQVAKVSPDWEPHQDAEACRHRVAHLRQEREATLRALHVAEAARDRQEQIRAAGAAPPDVAAIAAELDSLTEQLAAGDAERSGLLAALAALDLATQERRTRAGALSAKLRQAQRQLAAWEEQRRILETPVEGPTQADLLAAETRLATEEGYAATAAAHEKYQTALRAQAMAQSAADIATHTAERHRAAAGGLWERAAELLTEHVGGGLLRITPHEIYLRREDGSEVALTDDSRASAGRIRRAFLDWWLEEQPTALPEHGPIVLLPEEIMLYVDEDQRAGISRRAAAKGIKLIFEQPAPTADGALALRWYGGAA